MSKRINIEVKARTANDLSVLDINVKHLMNWTHDVHENIFRFVSLRHLNRILHASIGNNIRNLFGQIWISRERTRKKERESNNLKNGEMHGDPICNECCSLNAVGNEEMWRLKRPEISRNERQLNDSRNSEVPVQAVAVTTLKLSWETQQYESWRWTRRVRN